jgi:hypothetical protein
LRLIKESPVKKTELLLVALLATSSGYAAQPAATPPDSDPAVAAGADTGITPASPGVLTGEIVETMDAAGYTYMLLDTGTGKVWVATGKTRVEPGQRVSVPGGQVMTDFPSKTLDRTFDRIVFASGVYPEGALDKTAAQDHGMAGSSRTVVREAHVEDVARAAGGYTVEEILRQAAALNGQLVKVRGRVVKFTADIMGTNWIHIQDGSAGDLTVTSGTIVNKGDLVMVEGILSVNRDFGAGYLYPAIIEKAVVTRE